MDTTTSIARDLERRIATVLRGSGDNQPLPVTVHLHGSCATLKGDVHSWAEHEAADRTARSMPGVTSVDNQLCLLVKATLA